ncbi:MAG: penicillin-binding protein 2 [Phycisphaerae bacterium]|nr:penicillin-binding protein 2 [Phycisphaerae bacterium]
MTDRPQNLVRPARPMTLGQALAFLATAMLIGCAYRLIWLEKHRSADLREAARKQQTSSVPYLARRGWIVDSNPINPGRNTVLAASYLVDSVYIDAKPMQDETARRELVDRLATILNMGPSERGTLLTKVNEAAAVAARQAAEAAAKQAAGDEGEAVPEDAVEASPDPSAKKKRTPNPRCVWIDSMRWMEPAQSAAIRKLMAERDPVHKYDKRYPGLAIIAELKRDYPAGRLAAHQIGFLDKGGQATEGLELRFDKWLRGIDGAKWFIRTGRGQPLWSTEKEYDPPLDGLTLVLNLNAVIQSNVEQVLLDTVKKYQAESGTAVVMDVRTGAIWAMANVPMISLRKDNPPEKDAPYVREADEARRRNRALTDPFEPGSIFKWVNMAGAIDKHVVRETDTFDCSGGVMTIGKRVVHDVHGYGQLTVRLILVKSSNIGMSRIGMKMGKDLMYKNLCDFGLGQKTGVELNTVESEGKLKPLAKWQDGYTNISISFGQEISVTPLQMVRAFSAICNGGYLLTPRLVRAVVDDSAVMSGGAARVVEDYSVPKARRILQESTCKTMIDIMAEVVTKGTGQKAKSDKVAIFGKTGTAQIFERGHDTGEYTSSFICGAPVAAPRIAVIVSIRKPKKSIGYYGGTVAAPPAKQIVEDTLTFLNARGSGQ